MSATMIPPPAAPDFLAAAGWGDAQTIPLAGDASFRRYFRVERGAERAVLMDAPPPNEDPRPFIAVAQWLVDQGLSAPRLLATAPAEGLVLLEDFGDVRMRELVDATPSLEPSVYGDAVALLVDLAAKPAMALKPYSMREYQRELAIFTDWYCPALDLAVDVTTYAALWSNTLAPIIAAQSTPVTVLRDYHSENIMLLPERSGVARLGLLDFQDALAGHPAYDLVSLLQDARRDVSPELEAAMRAAYVARANPDAHFEAAYHILGVQRNLKILGIFTRLWKRDDKPRYLSFQPRVWAYIERNLDHPALAQVKAWLDDNVPHAKRSAAWADVG
jgi:N-acetylmuramate 1-kinase